MTTLSTASASVTLDRLCWYW